MRDHLHHLRARHGARQHHLHLSDPIWQSTLTPNWQLPSIKLVDADAGTQYVPIGDEGSITTPGLADNTLLFAPSGDPFGKLTVPVTFFNGTPGTAVTAVDHQFTLGEWKKCAGSYEIYKDPPSGKKYYNIVVRFSGCPANIMLTVWGFFSTSNKFDDLYLGWPLGGLPNGFEIGQDGTALFTREIDPQVWLKEGIELSGAWHGAANQKPHIPARSEFPNATFYLDVVFHNTGQSNGNPGWCRVDNTGKCVSPAAPDVMIPGNFGGDVTMIWSGGVSTPDTGLPTTKPIPIGMVQPY
jgi:hypothetical protein